jgi:tetratricopeptide (TPR) repeat protein
MRALHRLAGQEIEMKKRWSTLLLFMAFCLPVLAQNARVQGVARDTQGKPIQGAVVEFQNRDTGQTYSLKTDKNGQYLSIGIATGTYNIVLKQDGKEMFHFTGVHIGLDGLTQDIDLQKEAQQAAAGKGLSPEQLKQMQEEQAKQQARVTTIKALNEMLVTANQDDQAGNFDKAIATLNQATQVDPGQDLVWARLGEIQMDAANKDTDSAAKTQHYTDAAENLQKAIDLKQKAAAAAQENTAGKQTSASNPDKNLAAYYNDLGRADAKLGKPDDAIKAYDQAAQIDPTGAAQYYYNEGAVLTNSGKIDEAIAAFDKCIAADPNRADAYYWKGINMIGKAIVKGDKMVAPEGTAEAFNKYLELKPDGPFADPAKQMLASIGAPVETGFGKKKGSKK